MSVELSPTELGFRRPFNREVAETLHLSNPHDFPIGFKVKTTAPKQYCVRPNSGMIKASESMEVKVLLQAMKEDPPLDAKCRDKFLVQSAPLQVWSPTDKAPPASALQERKIRVTFLPAEGDASETPNAASSTQQDEEPPPYSSPSERFGSPIAHSSTSGLNAKDIGTKSLEGEKALNTSSAVNGVDSREIGSQPAHQATGSEPRWVNGQAESSGIATQMADPEMRQRKLQEATEKVQTAVQQGGETGVPVRVVAGLCLLSFLVAYFFF